MLVIPVELSEFTFYFLIFVSMVTSFITAAFGIGGGAVLIGLLALKLPPFALLPIHGIVQIGSNFGRTVIFIKEIKKDVLIPFTLGTILGSSLGGTFFIQIDPWLLQLIVAMFILWSVFGKIPAIGASHITFGGMFSGFFTMFFGASGTLVAGMVKTMKLEPVNHLATHSALMTIQHLIKVVIFGFVGFAYGEYFFLITGMIISGFIGTLVGKKVLIKFGKKYFQIVLNTILTLIALNLIWNAIKMSGYLNSFSLSVL
ncbi:MAG: sulfite exporter TauE/SafE family protein [Proteobacteria bacterium]|nr:sulfite exporter TauE/SafE family protein [Pseudomonadota bacterium]